MFSVIPWGCFQGTVKVWLSSTEPWEDFSGRTRSCHISTDAQALFVLGPCALFIIYLLIPHNCPEASVIIICFRDTDLESVTLPKATQAKADFDPCWYDWQVGCLE